MNDSILQSGKRNGERRRRARVAAVRFPLSALPFRRAITLIEVLISMGVLTLGILGVAALFPVGGHYARKANTYDRADAAAAAALNDAVTRGLVDPENWVSYELREAAPGAIWGGAYRQNDRAAYASFTRPFARDLRGRLQSPAYHATSTQKYVREWALNHQAGSIYFVDPVGVASGVNNLNQSQSAEALRTVPASVLSMAPITRQSYAWWQPWRITAAINRVSIARPNSPSSYPNPISLAMADRLTAIPDDLVVDLGDQADRPSQQRVLTVDYDGPSGSAPPVPGPRQAQKHFTYMLTVVPRTLEGRNALAFGGRNESYDVSAVVFDRRPLNRFNATDGFGGSETLARSERFCIGTVVSSGANGGEIRLSYNKNDAPDVYFNKGIETQLPWKDLEPGGYAMVYGPSPNSTPDRPQLFAQWYRVVAIDDQVTPSTSNVFVGPSVALRGPDWPWGETSRAEPGQNNVGDYGDPPSGVQDDLRVLIFDGVVAVHTRTMRLDAGTAWEQ
ncbi:hypothetical protein Pla123a_37750 [Posidoniimonas polymericola]|uniref:Uncharacterized protein n=1 Tax=Posidoniimonas polymericola TaxID=2528002 RepID=A0A5C5YDK6_9BACT|nr:hypothetical protein [Posidoniimonas polymericola]TWT73440.1 hypothetical protein Pla123a_37750 [Posidoniimonas polymericola]